MKLKHENVLIYGMSVSGEWASKLLIKNHANVFLYDDDGEVRVSKNIKGAYILDSLNAELLTQFDFCLVSPGVPQDNPHLKILNDNGIKIYSETEFASLFCKQLVAITGTNGKTTTVQLISKILNKKKPAIACGNNGYPLSRAVLEKNKSIKVVEVSSFMLEHADSFCPHIATITNIEPDHLTRHKTMSKYKRLKYSIFKNLTIRDYAVINMDGNINQPKCCKIVTYSCKHIADVYTKNGYIYLHQDKVIAIADLKIKGKHNIYNVMCAICFGYIFNVPIYKIRQALMEFEADDFRNQYICKANDIHFINDSKSTNIASSLASVDAIKGPIILLLGGCNKMLDYTSLFNKLSHKVYKIFAYGEIKQDLLSTSKGKFDVTICQDLNHAFDIAVSIAKPNDTVLLSPATASYDQFKDYIERGNFFNFKVNEYVAKTKKE